MIDFKRIYFKYTLFDSILVEGKEKIEEIAKRQLCRAISIFITNSLETIPHTHKVERDNFMDGESHSIALNIISDNEINRLKNIEREYMYLKNSLLHQD